MGLLNFLPEDEAKKQAARQGLLSLGAAMLQGKGNFGNMLGQGIQAGAQGYQGSLQEQQAAQMRQLQGDRWKLENDQTRAAIAEPGELARIVGGGQMPAAQTAAPQGGVMPLSALPTAGGQPSAQPAAVIPNSAEYYRAIGDRLSASGRVKAAEPYYNMAEKMKPKLKEQRTLTKDGKRVMANVYDDGRTEMVEGFAPDAEKLSFQNTGGATVALDPFTGLPVQTIRNSQSPDSVASNARMSAEGAANRAQSARQHGERLSFDKSRPDGAMKPMPTAALKMQQAELDAIGVASGIQSDLGAIEQQIKGGKLDFGPIDNLIDRGRNMAGMSNEASRNKASFKSSLEKLRNDSLRLNAGVQTDGDAQRAWNELFENINDKGVVVQRLGEIKRLNERAVKQRKMNVDGIRANYGRDPADTSAYENQPAALGPKTAAYSDAEKERRYQEWKASQGKK